MTENEIKDPFTIEAVYIRESTKSYFMNCEGDFQWFPKSQVNINKKKETMELPGWLLRKTFPKESF